MKLAFVHRRFGVDGGTERFLEALTRRLGERGHAIEVYSATVDPRFARTRVATFRRLVAGGRGLLKNLLLWVAAGLQVRRGRFDVVLHLGRTGPLDIYRAGGGCHRTWHGLLLEAAEGRERFALKVSFAHRFRLWHERKALLSTSRVVVPSESARRDLVSAYGDLADKVEVIHNGVDLDRFHPRTRQLFFEEERRRLGLRPEELVLLFVGSDYWRKGLDTLLRAMARLVTDGHGDDLRLLAVGGDARRDRFVALAAELGLRERVTFLSHHDAPERLYAAADVLALPTRYDPFANVTLEGLASGLPVVTSARNGACEAVRDRSAFTVLQDASDDAALAEALEIQLRTGDLQLRRGQARAAAQECCETGAVDRWERLLREVADARRAS